MIFVIVIGTKSGTRQLARTKPELVTLLDFSLHTLPTVFFFPTLLHYFLLPYRYPLHLWPRSTPSPYSFFPSQGNLSRHVFDSPLPRRRGLSTTV